MVALVLYLLIFAAVLLALLRVCVRSYRTGKTDPDPDTLTAELMANKRHLRRLEIKDWFRMWDEALSDAERAEKRILHQRHKNGESTADHRHGLFPGDYIRSELKEYEG
jgi:hypothetical protein